MIDITIQGKTPLVIRKFTDKDAIAATSGTRPSSGPGNDITPRQDCEEHLHLSEKTGKPIVPAVNVMNSIIYGGKFFKLGKSKVTTLTTSLVPAGIFIEEIELPIKHKEPWTVDTRPVRIPATGGRILRHRALFEDWELSFTLDHDSTLFSEKFVRDIIDTAGSRSGLGEMRPSCKGPYGRFVVIHWKSDNPESKRGWPGENGKTMKSIGKNKA